MTKSKFSKHKRSSLKTNFRIYILIFFILTAVAMILFRLYTLQVLAHSYYRELASDQHKIFEDLIPKRGEIFVRDGDSYYPVAVNKELNLVFAVPREVENPRETARQIAPILELDERELEEKIDNRGGWYAVLKHKVDEDKASQIREKKLKGIYMSPEDERFYPGGNFASQLVGFVGSDGNKVKGRYGLEAYWNKELEGSEGRLEQERDTGGRWISISEKVMSPAEDGADLYLTVDHTIQYRAEMAIKKALEKFKADSGSIVILEPQTGAVLAMASAPDFNPNDFSGVEDMSLFANPVVNHIYECGSVFKPITMSAGIDAKVVTPDTTYTDTGAVNEAGYTIKNSDGKANGVQTMMQVLEKSLNTGAIFVGKLLGNLRFYEYMKNFGFGEKTEIDTLGEVPGSISGLAELKNINTFTATFGQGISMTPIQLVNAFATIANGGKLIKPHLVEKIVYKNGSEIVFQPEKKREVISKETSLDLARMLVSVVKNGHGKRAGVPGYLIAGKTGTAQIPKKDGPGYEEGAHVGSFAGFAPAYDPKFVMLVKLDNPRNVEWAESSAAPTFGEMAKFMLDYFGVEPTEEYTQRDVDLFNATHDVSIYQAPREEQPTPQQPAEEEKKKDKKKKKK
ncbi:MAG: penicillin-binding protein 2 [Candidatus Moranbacteria bacterium CG_4_8_14_3_um_filter_43_15]|nr:MAG: penicillin-binding protein 2 [Candidatus Moranbacteria bacterium CG_4_8_14_3_um_filter_43_15]